MNNLTFNFEKLQADLEGMRLRIPDVPTSEVLLSRLLLHLGRGIGTLLDHEIRPFGLAEAEFRVLTTLFSQPDGIANPTDLCSRTSQSPANMSRISDALVARELITRESSVHDRRKMVLRTTPAGEELVRRLLPRLFAPLCDMLKDFSEAEQQQLVAQLQRLGSTLERVLVCHGPDREAGT